MSSDHFPWRNGYWKVKNTTSFIYIFDGENVEIKNLYCLDYPGAKCYFKSKLVAGDFGPTTPEICEMTGVDTYNVQWDLVEWNMKTPAVLSKGGTCIHVQSIGDTGIDIMEYQDEAQLEALKENREPENAPSLPSYIKLTPEHMGRILWFSGPPGAGKSTTSQLMGKYHGYVYYEADCYNICVNPFIDLDKPNPSMQQKNQTPLKGRKVEVIESVEKMSKIFEDLQKGKFDDFEKKMNPSLYAMSHHIAQQRKRIGGNWAVAWACFSRAQRDILREIFGPELVIIVLKMTKECVRKRLLSRHGGSTEVVDMMVKMHQIYEDAGENELNAYNLNVNENMSENDVVAEVMKIVKSI